MIRYPLVLEALKDEIKNDADSSQWLDEADLRLAAFAKEGKFSDDFAIPKAGGGTKKSSNIWSEIKPFFMKIQGSKCAYCERLLETEEYGRIEHDLEHYRPKSKTKPWKLPSTLRDLGITLTPPLQGSTDLGYHLLSYHLLNYCSSCKVCNSTLKSNNFPIAGTREPGSDDPVALRSVEEPYLIFPLGDFDEDPEDLITFFGVTPIPKKRHGKNKRRAQVTIEFFKLNDDSRKTLYRERAEAIIRIYTFKNHDSPIYDKLVDFYTSPAAPHTNCARSFLRLMSDDPNKAKEVFDAASRFILSIS